MFRTLDDDNDGTISLAEYYDLVDILQFSYQRLRTQPYLQRTLPPWAWDSSFGKLAGWVRGPRFAALTNSVLGVNAVAILLESAQDLKNSGPLSDAAWAEIELVFSFYGCRSTAESYISTLKHPSRITSILRSSY